MTGVKRRETGRVEARGQKRDLDRWRGRSGPWTCSRRTERRRRRSGWGYK